MIMVHIITFFYIYKSNFIYLQMNFPSMQWRSRNMQSCSRHTRTPKWMDMKNRNKNFFFNFVSNCTCSIGWYNGAGAESFSFVKLYFVKTVLHITNLKAACVTMLGVLKFWLRFLWFLLDSIIYKNGAHFKWNCRWPFLWKQNVTYIHRIFSM